MTKRICVVPLGNSQVVKIFVFQSHFDSSMQPFAQVFSTKVSDENQVLWMQTDRNNTETCWMAVNFSWVVDWTLCFIEHHNMALRHLYQNPHCWLTFQYFDVLLSSVAVHVSWFLLFIKSLRGLIKTVMSIDFPILSH